MSTSQFVVMDVVPLFNMGLLLWFLIHSRRWTAPFQAALLATLRHEVDILKGNQEGARGERLNAQQEWLENNDRVWKELRAINARLDSLRCSNPSCPLFLSMDKGAAKEEEGEEES